MRETKQRLKKGAKRLLFVWRAIVAIILSSILIPLFVSQGASRSFYTWAILPSLLGYLIITYIHLRLKKGAVKEYLERSATRLLLAMSSLALAFIMGALGIHLWTATLLVMSAVLYALFLQRLSFLRVIGI